DFPEAGRASSSRTSTSWGMAGASSVDRVEGAAGARAAPEEEDYRSGRRRGKARVATRSAFALGCAASRPGSFFPPPGDRMKTGPLARDRHALYEAAVQAVDQDLDFFERAYRRVRGRSFLRLR